MLAISSYDFDLYGCPNCGCDTNITHASSNNTLSVVCSNCHLNFVVLFKGITESELGFMTVKNTHVEYPRLIEHPRRGDFRWNYNAPDINPELGEFFKPRGIGYDLAGFVKSRQAGERIIKMVKRVLQKEEIKTWLDYREREPNWIQVKFQKEEFDLEMLYEKTKDGILTEEILRESMKDKGEQDV